MVSLEVALPELCQFLHELATRVETGTIGSTPDLIESCRDFYSAERMAEIESVLPGWRRMASFADGETLWHVNMVMVALLRLDEYRSMPESRQQLMRWIVLLHDIAKEPVGGRDHRHAFRSAAVAGRILPKLGFPVGAAYESEVEAWFRLVDTATRFDEALGLEIQDNSRLPAMLGGVDRIFREPTRTAVAAIALHLSITTVDAWPARAPLTDDQVVDLVDDDVRPVLEVLSLADSGGWNLFDRPTVEDMYARTREVFRTLPRAPFPPG